MFGSLKLEGGSKFQNKSVTLHKSFVTIVILNLKISVEHFLKKIPTGARVICKHTFHMHLHALYVYHYYTVLSKDHISMTKNLIVIHPALGFCHGLKLHKSKSPGDTCVSI